MRKYLLRIDQLCLIGLGFPSLNCVSNEMTVLAKRKRKCDLISTFIEARYILKNHLDVLGSFPSLGYIDRIGS